jgi:hypothetical protein
MAQPADLAVLGLVIDASGAIKGIQAAEGKLVSLEQSFGKVQKAAAVAFGAGLGLALGLFVKNTIDAEREVAALPRSSWSGLAASCSGFRPTAAAQSQECRSCC